MRRAFSYQRASVYASYSSRSWLLRRFPCGICAVLLAISELQFTRVICAKGQRKALPSAVLLVMSEFQCTRVICTKGQRKSAPPAVSGLGLGFRGRHLTSRSVPPPRSYLCKRPDKIPPAVSTASFAISALAFTRSSFCSRPLYKNQSIAIAIATTPPSIGHPPPLHRPHFCAI